MYKYIIYIYKANNNFTYKEYKLKKVDIIDI